MNNISRNSNLWGWHNRKSFEVIRNVTIPFLCGNFEQSWMWSVFWQVAHAETHTWKFKIRCGCSKKKYVPADWCNCSRFWNIKLWEVETFYGKWQSKKKTFLSKTKYMGLFGSRVQWYVPSLEMFVLTLSYCDEENYNLSIHKFSLFTI